MPTPQKRIPWPRLFFTIIAVPAGLLLMLPGLLLLNDPYEDSFLQGCGLGLLLLGGGTVVTNAYILGVTKLYRNDLLSWQKRAVAKLAIGMGITTLIMLIILSSFLASIGV